MASLRLHLGQITGLFFKSHTWESSETQHFLQQETEAEIPAITRNTNQRVAYYSIYFFPCLKLYIHFPKFNGREN